MSGRSSIEWTEATWNPISGCTKVSPGCKNCYAERISKRLRQDFSKIVLHPDRLEAPLHWRKPRRVFVNSMSDLFHESIPDEFIDRVFAVMALAWQHTFQVLTKRPLRMFSYLKGHAAGGRHIWPAAQAIEMPNGNDKPGPGWPLPNVWLGVSVEDQERADKRIPPLLQTPAAVRFVSAEPLLGPIDFMRGSPFGLLPAPGLDWVIIGGESGPGARPMGLTWARTIVAQCRVLRIPCFMKQLGSTWAKTRRVFLGNSSSKGGNPREWPEGLRVREYPT